MELRFRDMITSNTVCNYEIEDLLNSISEDEKQFSSKPSELKYAQTEKLGQYNVITTNEDYVIIYSDKEAIAALTVYELYGFEIIQEKEMIVLYGHEEIIIYFLDGTLKKIATR